MSSTLDKEVTYTPFKVKDLLSSARFSQNSKKLCFHAINGIFHFEMGVPDTILGYVCTKKEKQKW